MPRRCNHHAIPADAVLPDGTVIPAGLTYDPDCDPDGCSVSLMMEPVLIDAIDDWAEHTAAQVDLLRHLDHRRGYPEPYDYLLEHNDR